MLYEQQAAELLRRCEAIAGQRLSQVRGNLRKAETRAEAVWELLVLEAASKLGTVECEPPEGGPDIRLCMPSGRWASIEVTYLHPRFEDEEDRCHQVTMWLAAAERSIATARVALECNFVGGNAGPSGTRLTLPAEHERQRFFNDDEVAAFLSAVRCSPNERHRVKLKQYSIELTSRPRLSDRDTFNCSSRPAAEAPQDVGEHAAFRALRTKLRQHKVDEPYIVCIGSDVSRVLRGGASSPEVGLPRALQAAVRPNGRVSAVLVVSIGASLLSEARTARSTLYPVPDCRHPLTSEEVRMVSSLDFNGWKFTFPLARRESSREHRFPAVGGDLMLSHNGRETVKLTIPASVLVDILSGRRSLLDFYGGGSMDHSLEHVLRNGCAISGCRFVQGNLERAHGDSVELEIGPTHESVYWGGGRAK